MVSHEGLDTLVEAVTGALAAGTDLDPAQVAALAATTDVLALGALADDARRARHGAAHDVRQSARARRSRRSSSGRRRRPRPPRCASSDARRVRDAAVAAVRQARALAGARAVRGFWLGDLEPLGDAVLGELRAAGLDEVAFVAPAPHAAVAVARARAAGLGVQVIADRPGHRRHASAWLLDARRLADAVGGITAVAPLPRQVDRATPTTGFDDVRTVALGAADPDDGAHASRWTGPGMGRSWRRSPSVSAPTTSMPCRRWTTWRSGRGGSRWRKSGATSPPPGRRRSSATAGGRRRHDERTRPRERGLVPERQTAGPGARSPARPLRSLLRPAVHLRRPAARRRGRPGADSRRRVPGRRLPVRARHRDRLLRADALGRGVHHPADRADPTPGARHQLAHVGGAVPHPVREALGDRARVRPGGAGAGRDARRRRRRADDRRPGVAHRSGRARRREDRPRRGLAHADRPAVRLRGLDRPAGRARAASPRRAGSGARRRTGGA